ncbi:hypothetical protein CHS0354_015111 [Potamilus streckersoni]|uniref:Uncharacterized protein n=1 Tax=Potamilus streckersoni TaxID=2493646 RepID=A0AAE0VZM1_9BIVA|nr:hypothetical protein CHS0354_015111 [Potamilus streckersoni]
MKKCWKIDVQDRPKFRAIANILDRILQEKTVKHPGRNNLYTRKQDIEELGSSFSSSSTYLTPSSNVLQQCEEKSSFSPKRNRLF